MAAKRSKLVRRFTAAVGLTMTLLLVAAASAAAEGASLLRDIYPGPKAGTGALEAARPDLGGRLFFSARDPTHGYELWRSDGTAAGTKLVRDIYPGTAGSRPSDLQTVGSRLFFSAANGFWGRELWRSDGTYFGTRLVRDIYPGGGAGRSSYPQRFTDVQGLPFFDADDGVHGQELWLSDGTAAGTQLVRDVYPGRNILDRPLPLASLGGRLLFAANDGVHGEELWISDGTSAGTTMLSDINPGAASSDPGGGIKAGGQVYFAANDGVHGDELWVSDGTSAGTRMVSDINPGAEGSGARRSAGDAVDLGGTLYFSAWDGTSPGLWRSDGTAAGTKLVADVDAGDLAVVGGTILFDGGRRAETGYELWRSDGTTAGTRLVRDIYPGYDSTGLPNESSPEELTDVGGTLFFRAVDGSHGSELWRSDGTGAGTRLVDDIREGSMSSHPSALRNFHGTLLFTADDGIHGRELWKAVP
jgi:ELWxxDGT repeat protein